MSAVLGVVLSMLLISLAPWAAASSVPTVEPVRKQVAVGGTGGGFDLSAGRELPASSMPTAGPPRQVSTTVREARLAPACSGNAAMGGGDALCTAALVGCPEGQLRFWVYARTRDLTAPAAEAPPYRLVTDPPFRCAGAEQAEIDPQVLIAGLIEREFRRVVVLRGQAEISPEPETLVNVPTRFETPTVERYDVVLELLGQSVVITAQAERWTWQTGDGSTPSTTAKGTRGRVEHAYRSTAAHAPSVSIEWSGTYRVNSGEPRVVPGRVTTGGDPVELQVREARAELVAD